MAGGGRRGEDGGDVAFSNSRIISIKKKKKREEKRFCRASKRSRFTCKEFRETTVKKKKYQPANPAFLSRV